MAVSVKSSQSSTLGSNSGQYYLPAGACNFDFLAKIKFESESTSVLRRSELYKVAQKPYIYDVWELTPPDFNPQVFEPSPIKRNTREAIEPWKYDERTTYKVGSAPNAKERRRNDKRKNDFFSELEQAAAISARAKTCGDFQSRPRDLQLRFKIADPYRAKIEFVRNGMHRPGTYEMPQPHDYRQYPTLKSLGLPTFVTSYDRDCMGLKCKSAGLGTLQGRPINFLREVPVRTRADYAIPRPLKWDDELILPKLPFPNKQPAYTRHRRSDRSARSAFLERAEMMMEKRRREIEEFKQNHLLQEENV